MVSLRSLHISKQRSDRINSADLGFFYGNFDYGAQFAELAIDYSEHYSFERFIQYVREMNVPRFLYYVLGRYLSENELQEYFSASGWHPENRKWQCRSTSQYDENPHFLFLRCVCMSSNVLAIYTCAILKVSNF